MAKAHPSVKKRARQNERRRQHRAMQRSALRTTVKKVV
ncbi:MAG: 30S ribosomal protein S20, partial [Candidatus Tectomicrobia bacterium]